MTHPADFPASYGLQLVELCERWSVTPAEVLLGLDLSLERLAEPSARLSTAQMERLIARARSLTGEPGLGVYLGLHMRHSAHGHLGFAAMVSSTVREALELTTRFSPTRTTALRLHLHEAGEVAALVIEETASLGTAREVIILSLLVSLMQMNSFAVGRKVHGRLEVAFDEPDYMPRFRPLLGESIRFSQPQHRLVFDRSVLALPILLADKSAARLAKEQCERELRALGYDGDLLARVRAQLVRPERGFRSLDEVAHGLHLSTRTLKRKLAQRDTTFSALLDEARYERATLLLGSEEHSIEQVAQSLGYTDPANFTRAFRRWSGRSPRAYREARSVEHASPAPRARR